MTLARNILNRLNVNEAKKKKPTVPPEILKERELIAEQEAQMQRDRNSMEKLLKGIDGAKIFASFTKMIIQIEKASDATEIIKLYNTFKTEHPISIYAVDQFKYVFKNNMD